MPRTLVFFWLIGLTNMVYAYPVPMLTSVTWWTYGFGLLSTGVCMVVGIFYLFKE